MDDILIYAEGANKVVTTLNFGLFADIIIFFTIIAVLFKLVNKFEQKLHAKLKASDSSMLRFLPMFKRLIKGLILFFMVATFLQSHGYSMNSIIAGFGITGLAVGFAAKETIANIFGAISILSDKSFKLGDYVVIGGIEGTVEDINMRSTKIRDIDNSILVVPNSVVAGSIIKNTSLIKRRRILEVIEVKNSTSEEKLRRIVETIDGILVANPDSVKDHFAFVEKITDNGINIKFSTYIKTTDYAKFAKIREGILLEVLAALRAEGIELAPPRDRIK